VSAKAGWYPDPGGIPGLFRYWDGKAWSAATSPNPSAPPPTLGLGSSATSVPPTTGSTAIQDTGGLGSAPGTGGLGSAPGTGGLGSAPGTPGYGSSTGYGQPASGQQPLRTASPYTDLQQVPQKRSGAAWWIVGAVLVIAIVVIGVLAIRAVTGGTATPATPGGQPSSEVCPPESTETASPSPRPNDGRVHGGPLSYPLLGPPWLAPQGDTRVPFGSDVQSQQVVVEPNYEPGSSWVASILIGELQAGDGFFTPEQGSQIVVKCILGAFYGDNPVNSDVKVNKATTIDGHEAWLVESHLTFDIPNLETKGETLIVAIVAASNSSGLYYASIPDTVPDLLPVARKTLEELTVDG
jgi:hypothetical protein